MCHTIPDDSIKAIGWALSPTKPLDHGHRAATTVLDAAVLRAGAQQQAGGLRAKGLEVIVHDLHHDLG
jgi:hypothetical protein